MIEKINKVIKVLVASDLVLLFGWGLISPILAIFIAQNIQGGDVRVAGAAIGIYWLSKSALQIPIAHILDKEKGEKDDYYALIGGIMIASLAPIGFIFARTPLHIYLLQLVNALGMAFVVPSWSAIFTRHIDDGREALSWSLDSSALGIGSGVAGILGGVIAEVFGFIPLFIGVAVSGFLASTLLLLISKDIIPKGKVFPLPKPQ